MPVRLGMTVDQAKKHFIDIDKVDNAVERGRMRALNRSGGAVRQTARRSMRKARRKRKSELTERELLIWEIRKREAKEEGKPNPLRPIKHSEPGEAPRWITKEIRNQLFYIYDPNSKSVVTGPALLNSKGGAQVLQALEEGGRTNNGREIAARPFMAPAYKKNESRIVQFWKDSIK